MRRYFRLPNLLPHIPSNSNRETNERSGRKEENAVDEESARSHRPVDEEFTDDADDDIEDHENSLSFLKDDQLLPSVPAHSREFAEEGTDERPAK